MLKGDPRGGRVRQYGDISILWGGRILERPASPDPGMDGITSSCCDRLGKEENEYETEVFSRRISPLSERISAVVTRLVGKGKA